MEEIYSCRTISAGAQPRLLSSNFLTWYYSTLGNLPMQNDHPQAMFQFGSEVMGSWVKLEKHSRNCFFPQDGTLTVGREQK